DVLPTDRIPLAAVRALYIHDLDHTLRNAVDTDVTSCFQHYRVAAINQRVHKGIDLFLFQRLAACYFDEFRRVAPYDRQYFAERNLTAAGIGILCIAIEATQRASRQPHEDARFAGPRGLALNGEKDFRDTHGQIGSDRRIRSPRCFKPTGNCSTNPYPS